MNLARNWNTILRWVHLTFGMMAFRFISVPSRSVEIQVIGMIDLV